MWREMRGNRQGFADPEHPFRRQGSADLNAYKLFVEVAHALTRAGGRIGVVIPSGLYTDKGTAELRELLLERCRWEWLFGFENRDKIFDIHRSFKFAAMVVEKGARTHALRTAFMRRKLADWDTERPQALAYPRARIAQFSPEYKTVLEVGAARDLEVLQKLYDNGVLLGAGGPDGWGIEYATEFHTTNDSRLFPPRPRWEELGYRADQYGHWLKGRWKPYSRAKRNNHGLVLSRDGGHAISLREIEDVAVPLYEGRMIGLLDPCEKGWVSGKGRRAVWRPIPGEAKVIEPQYLIGRQALASAGKFYEGPKLAYMRISSATNSRTTIATFLHGQPAADSVFFFRSHTASAEDCLFVTGVFASLVYDFMIRFRLGGLNLSEFVMVETALPQRKIARAHEMPIRHLTMRLALVGSAWSRSWAQLGPRERALPSQWALTSHERLRLRAILDALVADAYQLDVADMGRILSDCDHPAPSASALDPKGFWRVDKDKPPELRHTVLALVAFHELQRMGAKAFVEQNDGEGWMLPKTLRLADYGLGHDDRAKHHQPVAERLGPRFLAWQLGQSAKESWEECERHAERIERIHPLRRPERAKKK